MESVLIKTYPLCSYATRSSIPIANWDIYKEFFSKEGTNNRGAVMIHNFYIIKKNGICIFHEDYRRSGDRKDAGEDPQSVAGLLTAVSIFSKDVIRERVRTIATEHYKFFLDSDKEYMFAFLADDSHGNVDLQETLNAVKNYFYKKFPEVSTKHSSGDMNRFDALSGPVDSILKAIQ